MLPTLIEDKAEACIARAINEEERTEMFWVLRNYAINGNMRIAAAAGEWEPVDHLLVCKVLHRSALLTPSMMTL